MEVELLTRIRDLLDSIDSTLLGMSNENGDGLVEPQFTILETKTGYLVRMDVHTGVTWVASQATTPGQWIRIPEPLP